jgi:uncharacterized protein YqeY
MLVDEIKARLKAAMKAQRTIEKEILRVALGDIQTAEARDGSSISEEAAAQVVKKLLKSNRETLEATESEDARQTLQEEIAVLESLLPKSLGVDEIVEALAPVATAICEAKADGPATGIAMKHLKGADATVDGKDVAEAVRRLRQG